MVKRQLLDGRGLHPAERRHAITLPHLLSDVHIDPSAWLRLRARFR
jgi:hypothetical protein